MSKLLARAKVKYINAKNNYKMIAEDDAFLDDVCYNLQQCIEYCLKYMVEMQGEAYIENHDVRAQINRLKGLGVDIPEEEKLRLMASLLNSWEAETRYNDDFLAVAEDIDAVMQIASVLLTHCDALVTVD